MMSDYRPTYVREGEKLAKEILEAGYDSEFERETAWISQVEDDFLSGLWTLWERDKLLKDGYKKYLERWDRR